MIQSFMTLCRSPRGNALLLFICSGLSICLGKEEENPCLKEMVNISKADIFLTKCWPKAM